MKPTVPSPEGHAAKQGGVPCHPRCALGPNADHPGYLGYRCVTGAVESLPWPAEDGFEDSLVTPDHMVEVLAEEFYLVVMQATKDQWLLWPLVPQAERSGYYDLAYEVADKIRHPACAEACAPHLHQHCSPQCEIECASCVRGLAD